MASEAMLIRCVSPRHQPSYLCHMVWRSLPRLLTKWGTYDTVGSQCCRDARWCTAKQLLIVLVRFLCVLAYAGCPRHRGVSIHDGVGGWSGSGPAMGPHCGRSNAYRGDWMRLSNPHPVTSIGSIVGLCDYCRTASAGRGGELIKLDDTAKDVRFTEQDV